MKILHSIASTPDLPHPIALAIGTFDGLHLGHLRIISAMKEQKASTVVFTFSNHPKDIIQSSTPPQIPLITVSEHKLLLLSRMGVDFCIIQPFSKEMAEMHYQLFIEELYNVVPFEHLFFGKGSALGKNREGGEKELKKLGLAMQFKTHFIPSLTIDKHVVSSSNIRKALKKGCLDTAEKLLGRPFDSYIQLDSPFLEMDLLKPGKYFIEIEGEQGEFLCNVEPSGSIIFDPSQLKESLNRKALVIFKRKR